MASKNLSRFLIEMFTFVILFKTSIVSMCPAGKLTECNRNLKDFYDLVRVHSPLYNVDFLCDLKTDGGGWIIFQRRVYNYITFERDWDEYKNGFGDKCTDYWLGNEHVHKITTQSGKKWELRIDMRFKNMAYYAVYSNFYLEGEAKAYRLRYDKFVKGDAGDMFRYHRNMHFSTPDMDNDYAGVISCANKYQSGFWYNNCHRANLNGIFHNEEFGFGVIWDELSGDYASLDSVEMKMRHY